MILILGVLILLSTNTSNSQKNQIIGNWLYSGNFSDTLTRTDNFLGRKYGFKFNKNGKFSYKSPFKWCGNQKVNGSNYFGNWAYFNDSIVCINYMDDFGYHSKECDFKIINGDRLILDF